MMTHLWHQKMEVVCDSKVEANNNKKLKKIEIQSHGTSYGCFTNKNQYLCAIHILHSQND